MDSWWSLEITLKHYTVLLYVTIEYVIAWDIQSNKWKLDELEIGNVQKLKTWAMLHTPVHAQVRLPVDFANKFSLKWSMRSSYVQLTSPSGTVAWSLPPRPRSRFTTSPRHSHLPPRGEIQSWEVVIIMSNHGGAGDTQGTGEHRMNMDIDYWILLIYRLGIIFIRIHTILLKKLLSSSSQKGQCPFEEIKVKLIQIPSKNSINFVLAYHKHAILSWVGNADLHSCNMKHKQTLEPPAVMWTINMLKQIDKMHQHDRQSSKMLGKPVSHAKSRSQDFELANWSTCSCPGLGSTSASVGGRTQVIGWDLVWSEYCEMKSKSSA